MTAKSDLPAIPHALADVAMIDGATCAAAAGMSLSSWHELVRVGDAPPPVIRRPRFTRWRLSDARAWLIERAASPDARSSEQVKARASKASAKAQALRAAKAANAAPTEA